MKVFWKNNKGNDRLLILFSGWGMNPSIISFQPDESYDYCIVHSYQSCDLDLDIDFTQYDEVSLIAWSFGVLMAEVCFANSDLVFSNTIAINGTAFPVHDSYGIPNVIFDKTLEGLNESSYKKFLLRTCGGMSTYKEIQSGYIQDSIDMLRSSLSLLGDIAKTRECGNIGFWNSAIIGEDDKIIPASNQENYWKEVNVHPMKIQGLEHYPFLNANLIDHLFALI
ncbi:MAG: pimeloyl-ACP methyl esterase BioG family protein [Hyphomicrobiales bacterium]